MPAVPLATAVPGKQTRACGRGAPPAAKPIPGRSATLPGATPVKGAAKKDASVAFFANGVVPRLKIQISDAELQRLRQHPREYVRCTISEADKQTYAHVGIRLKGSAGSFRGLDDRPALTLNFDKFQKGQEFHDLEKIHLNNSVQDPTYLNELLASELFLAAGVPAARTTHARVWLNGRDLGFYVLKEGFGKDFLKRHGLDPNGNLYESGAAQDLDGQTQLESGSGPADRSDVKAVVEACREPEPARRWLRLEKLVDIDRFLTFMAMELMTVHWDGYSQNRNNYRFYFHPKSGKLQFFPHGLDQTLAHGNYSVLHFPPSMVCSAVLSNPAWRDRYRDRVSQLTKLFDPPDRLLQRVDAHHQRLRPVLAELGEDHAKTFDQNVSVIKDRLSARARFLKAQKPTVEARPNGAK